MAPKTPYSVLCATLREQCAAHGVEFDQIKRFIPKHWERRGDLLVLPEFSFDCPEFQSLSVDLWQNVARSLNADRLVRRRRIAADAYRSSQAELLLGDNGWVQHVENHIKYRYDVTKCMFSSGNITEKLRISRMNCAGQVVTDMFAGIGYFVLPYLVHAKAALVHACEWNKHAIEALKLNLALNDVDKKCVIHEGDCRVVCPVGVADRVNVGILPSSKTFLVTACQALKPTGGFLHVHENVTSTPIAKEQTQTPCSPGLATCEKNELRGEVGLSNVDDHSLLVLAGDCLAKWDDIDASWRAFAGACGESVLKCLKTVYNRPWKVAIVHLYRIKRYAPRIDHVVLDLECRPV